jgi:MATE family multidrug resistance protein
MASNQGHYVGTLPNDYAILARFASDDDHEGQNEENNRLEDEELASSTDAEVERPFTASLRARSPRRKSFPTSFIRPPPSTIPSMNFKSTPDKDPSTENGAAENTPLLVPRIEEGQSGDEDRTKSNTAMFWEEMRILSKYTLPVFGLVSSLVL